MKKYFKYKAAAVSMVTMAMSSVPAMAAENTETVRTETKEGTVVEEIKSDEAETIGCSVVSGTIKSVSVEENGKARIAVETAERGEIVFNEDTNLMVIEGNSLRVVNDLKEGMEVSVVMDDNAPMTMSIPPQTNGAIAFVIEGVNPSFVAVEKFDEELSSQTLKLNIDNSVSIIDINGSKKMFTADDIKGSKAIVVYGASTKSLPAQTTPYIVVILDEAENEQPAEEAPEDIVSLPLRATLEEMGYTVEWTANDAPIVLTKDELKASISIDSNSLVVDGDMVYELSENVKLVDGVTYVSSDIKNILR